MAAGAIQTIACDGCSKNIEAEDTVFCRACSDENESQAVEDATCPHCENMASAAVSVRAYFDRRKALGQLPREAWEHFEELIVHLEELIVHLEERAS